MTQKPAKKILALFLSSTFLTFAMSGCGSHDDMAPYGDANEFSEQDLSNEMPLYEPAEETSRCAIEHDKVALRSKDLPPETALVCLSDAERIFYESRRADLPPPPPATVPWWKWIILVGCMAGCDMHHGGSNCEDLCMAGFYGDDSY